MKEGQWRRRDLDRGKTLGVLLVVLGHLVARQDPSGPGWGAAWYEPLRASLYTFHIPFLFYLSGYAAGWSGAATVSGPAWAALLQRRARHWLGPALLFGLAILAGKCLVQGFLHVDHAPASFAGGLVNLLWRTDDSPAQSVWYLVVLFAYAVCVPPLFTLLGERQVLLLALSLAVMPLPLPPLLFADRLLLYLPFYLAGILTERHDTGWCAFLDQQHSTLLGLFAIGFGLLLLLAAEGLLMRIPRAPLLLAASALAIPALHAAVRRLAARLPPTLDWLCPHAFAIYLLNTIFIGLAKALLMTVMPWEARWFPLFAPLLLAAGILGPVAAQSLVGRRRAPAAHLLR
ncbi:MAG TPA: acyltransferase family protein [Acidisoma sp.]|jgi:fucose 4-O-acetylase-like acetyltransferase|uniref:acyltransferase family protein n=1 Tax=Acidisoma sp. TaxID=1872115 RepID=UPI002C701D03|nr:acyltransferase family protein [Acidisoma sp.]HTI01519.1 acyltransferase family protein [Acidisoma sp.]